MTNRHCGTHLPSDGLWLNASKSEFRLEGDDALESLRRRAQLDGSWAVSKSRYPTLRERGKGRSLVGASSCSKGGMLNRSQTT